MSTIDIVCRVIGGVICLVIVFAVIRELVNTDRKGGG